MSGVDPVREEILGKLRERILAFAASRIERASAEDVAQETLILLHEKYPHVTRMEELVPLAMQIARFKMTALQRKSVRRGETTAVPVEEVNAEDGTESPLAALERKEMTERLEKALAQMGDRCREMFRMKLEGRSFAEIQEALGAESINTVYTWDFRCRKHLMELMGGSYTGVKKTAPDESALARSKVAGGRHE